MTKRRNFQYGDRPGMFKPRPRYHWGFNLAWNFFGALFIALVMGWLFGWTAEQVTLQWASIFLLLYLIDFVSYQVRKWRWNHGR
jgi:hypothetical protein